jgi:hypothetical protein
MLVLALALGCAAQARSAQATVPQQPVVVHDEFLSRFDFDRVVGIGDYMTAPVIDTSSTTQGLSADDAADLLRIRWGPRLF